MVTGKQIREARHLLRWAPSDLAHRSGLRQRTVERAESTVDEPPITVSHAAILQRTLERAGIAFERDTVRIARAAARTGSRQAA